MRSRWGRRNAPARPTAPRHDLRSKLQRQGPRGSTLQLCCPSSPPSQLLLFPVCSVHVFFFSVSGLPLSFSFAGPNCCLTLGRERGTWRGRALGRQWGSEGVQRPQDLGLEESGRAGRPWLGDWNPQRRHRTNYGVPSTCPTPRLLCTTLSALTSATLAGSGIFSKTHTFAHRK